MRSATLASTMSRSAASTSLRACQDSVLRPRNSAEPASHWAASTSPPLACLARPNSSVMAAGVFRSSESAAITAGCGCARLLGPQSRPRRGRRTAPSRAAPSQLLPAPSPSSRSAGDNGCAAWRAAALRPASSARRRCRSPGGRRIVTKFPRLLDIFCPSTCRKPLCIQTFAIRPWPKAQVDWAISFSWCGKTRSMPPPWMSNTSPRCCQLIAEHSMCQPGRPGRRDAGRRRPGRLAGLAIRNLRSGGGASAFAAVLLRIQAQIHADAAALERIYADDFIGVGPSGTVRTKPQVISDFTSGDLRFQSITTDDVRVRVYGNAAVETGRSTMNGQDKGNAVPHDTRFTRVWVKQHRALATGRQSLLVHCVASIGADCR